MACLYDVIVRRCRLVNTSYERLPTFAGERTDTKEEEALWMLMRLRRRIDRFNLEIGVRFMTHDAQLTQHFEDHSFVALVATLGSVHAAPQIVPEYAETCCPKVYDTFVAFIFGADLNIGVQKMDAFEQGAECPRWRKNKISPSR